MPVAIGRIAATRTTDASCAARSAADV